MPAIRVLILLVLCGPAVRAAELLPLMARPITLPRGTSDLTLHGTYTNWDLGLGALGGPSSLTGETLALGADFGVTDRLQVGLGVALPIHPGASFGSVLGSVAFAAHPNAAVRFDAGVERIGANGDNTGTSTHAARFFLGFGPRIKVPLSQTLAFVTGRSGTVHFGHFNNIGDQGAAIYSGASFFPETASDFFVVSVGDHDTGTNIGINLPAGLLLQPDPHLAVTLLAGYSVAIAVPDTPGASTAALHFIPVGLEAVVSPDSMF